MRPDFPLPDTEWEPTREFWAAAARGELAIPRCDACGTYAWYPREACEACGRSSFTWTTMSGRGRLFAWTVVRHAFLAQFSDDVPYATGLVALDEDPSVRIVTRIVDCDPERLVFEMPLRVVFRPLSFPGIDRTVTAPFFAPAEG
jgi:uncharacterized OB-fold protein